jgi:hypothetical protein
MSSGKEYFNKEKSAFWSVIAVSIVGGIAIFSVYYNSAPEKKSQVEIFIAVVGVLGTLVAGIFQFLTKDKVIDKRAERIEIAKRKRARTFKNFEATLKTAGGDTAKTAQLLTDLEQRLIQQLDEKYKDEIQQESNFKAIKLHTLSIITHVESYIGTIKKNSVINLIIGICATLTGIAILSVTIFTTRTFLTLNDFVVYYVPRLFFAGFIQLFAFFFLRLYKSNLEDGNTFKTSLPTLELRHLL